MGEDVKWRRPFLAETGNKVPGSCAVCHKTTKIARMALSVGTPWARVVSLGPYGNWHSVCSEDCLDVIEVSERIREGSAGG